ncbi:MAG: hypothetical protein HQK53_19605 [Oligoflexia bacterium]|nr:hypothetical protein [Oligoflexia bacterium]
MLVELDFCEKLSNKSAEDFLQGHILTNDRIKAIFFGHDFSFGAGKQGTYENLQRFCEDRGVLVKRFPPLMMDGQVVSSSKIRELILSGDVVNARKFLGRDFFIQGEVINDKGLGSKWGIPTANLKVDEKRILPKNGVYITLSRVSSSLHSSLNSSSVVNDKFTYHPSVTNIGFNPTVEGDQTMNFPKIETHILNFSKNIAGEQLTLFFLQRIRDEKKFSAVDELISAIKNDIEICTRFYLPRPKNPSL